MPRHKVAMFSQDAADLVKTFPSITLLDKSYGKEKEYLKIVNAKTVTPPKSKFFFVMNCPIGVQWR